MSSFRLFGFACLLAAGFACVCFTGWAAGISLPLLTAPTIYEGEYNQDNNTYSVFLYLGVEQGFVLREDMSLPNGKNAGWEATGIWHQIRDRAFLQLFNKSGLYRLMNVGGAGDIYLGIQLPTGKQATVVLRRQHTAPVEYSVSGMLRGSQTGLLFEDGENGITYAVEASEAIAELLRSQSATEPYALPVRALVAPAKGNGAAPALHIKNIQSIPKEKDWEAQNTSSFFLNAVAGEQWRITRIGVDEPPSLYTLSFLPERGKRNGRLEIFDGSRPSAGSYVLHETTLTLSADTTDARLDALLRQTRTWQLVGEVLELRDEKGILALLEKIR